MQYTVDLSDLVISGGICRGEAVFRVMQPVRPGRALDTGWFYVPAGPVCGAGDFRFSQKAFFPDRQKDVQVFGQPGLAVKALGLAAVPLKISAVYDPSSQQLRILVSYKKTLDAGTYTVYWFCEAQNEPSDSRQEKQEAPETSSSSGESTKRIPQDDAFYIRTIPVIHPGWKYTIRAHVPAEYADNDPLDEPCVAWEIPGGDENGTIDKYGCYTAPDKPGAYGVKATLKPTGATAHAYIMVREKQEPGTLTKSSGSAPEEE